MTITIGVLSALVMEGLKWLYRKITKQPDYDFSEVVYVIVLAGLSILLVPVMAVLDLGEYVLPANWLQWALDILLAIVSALGTYYVALKPLKAYRKERLNGSVG